MPTQPSPPDDTKAADVDAPVDEPAARGRRSGRGSPLRRLLAWSAGAGLVAGLASGCLYALQEGWQYRGILDGGLWLDLVSHAGLADGVFWSLNGVLFGMLCVVASLPYRLIGRLTGPIVARVALLLLGAAAFVFVLPILRMLPNVASGPGRTWLFVAATCVVVAAAFGRFAAPGGRNRLIRFLRLAGRVAFGISAAILLGFAVIQWAHRPRLMAPTTRWQHASPADTPRRKDARPDILLVVLDTQRVDRLGCYGYDRPTTPRLDTFAADALVFENCISPAIWTLPSHASLFTGLFPREHGANLDHQRLEGDFATMAELLRRVGYDTAAFSNNAWVGTGSNLAQGFDLVVCPRSLHEPRGGCSHPFLDELLYPAGLVGKWLGAATVQDEGAELTSSLVARWLDGRDSRRPFFLFVNYLEPHSPYRPSLPHREVFLGADDVDASYRNAWRWHEVLGFSLLGRELYTPRRLRMFNDAYDGETRWLDDYVGDLLEIFAARARLDDALVIVTADHGENIGDHHLMTHYWCVYDTLAHVPLIMRYPKRLRPGRTGELVQLTDLLPTVMDAVCGSPVPTASTFGRSLLPPAVATSRSRPATTSVTTSASDGPPQGRVAVTELMAPESFRVATARQMDPTFKGEQLAGPIRAIRQGGWKYILWPNGREELYHIADDPRETKDLIDVQRPIADRLARRLAVWLDTAKAFDGGPGRTRGPDLDDATRRRVRDLGYIQ